MTSISTLFEQSRRPQIRWRGTMLHRLDDFAVLGASRLRLTRLSTSSSLRQGVSVRTRTAARLRVQGVTAEHMVFWEDAAPDQVIVELDGGPNMVEVKNVWAPPGEDYLLSWMGNAAMIVEELPNGRLYRCNDGEADEDFDDIVFKLERLPD